jgi:hypothetical protein
MATTSNTADAAVDCAGISRRKKTTQGRFFTLAKIMAWQALLVRLQLPERQALLVQEQEQEQVLLLFYRKLPKQRQQ